MHWDVGGFVSERLPTRSWGDAASTRPKAPLARGDEFLSSLMRETTWTNNLHIVARHAQLSELRDSYSLEWLDLPTNHQESDLREAIVIHLRDFILEFGSDLSLIGQEYRIQVGMTDGFIDLLFFHRGLSCLVAIELKLGRFRPEYVGQLDFYLEALDRDVRKPSENPSVGLILCSSKDDTVVEYALSRSLSPTMVAEYELRLPDKAVLQAKLRELSDAAALEVSEDAPS
jgi:predicted nuclease of restriction endonuclease-like (RecB) superfamily